MSCCSPHGAVSQRPAPGAVNGAEVMLACVLLVQSLLQGNILDDEELINTLAQSKVCMTRGGRAEGGGGNKCRQQREGGGVS
jgi:hypothetical protein